MRSVVVCLELLADELVLMATPLGTPSFPSHDVRSQAKEGRKEAKTYWSAGKGIRSGSRWGSNMLRRCFQI